MSKNECFLESGTPEQRVLVALSLPVSIPFSVEIARIIRKPLNWGSILELSIQHRTLWNAWDNLKKRSLINEVIRSGGFSKIWAVTAAQLYWINVKKNEIFLKYTEDLFTFFVENDLEAVCLKGAALIGDVYHCGNRRMHDVDLMIDRSHEDLFVGKLSQLGFLNGKIDHETGDFVEMPSRHRRFWRMNNHVLPPLYLPTANEVVPYYKLGVGFDLFDPADVYSVPANLLIAEKQPKSQQSTIFIPSYRYMFISLCSHIYREGVSATYAANGDNFSLAKFSDLLRLMLKSPGGLAENRALMEDFEGGLAGPLHYALALTIRVYGDIVPQAWRSIPLKPPDNYDRLIFDGSKMSNSAPPFRDRVFHRERFIIDSVGASWLDTIPLDSW